MKLLVASKKDFAGMNIAGRLIETYQFQATVETFQQNPVYVKRLGNVDLKLIFINDESVQAQYLTSSFKPELIVFVSRHSSESGNPTLSVHTPGNLGGEAKLGGMPKGVSVSPANAMKNALMELARLQKETGLGYAVSYEGTHHGPSLEVPTMFVELGSSLEQWKDLEAAEIVAHAAVAAATKQTSYPAVLGIGGLHYNERFTRTALTTPIAFGHMVPKYAVPWIDSAMIEQCIQRTAEKVDHVVLDWKGIKGEDKPRLMAALAEVNISVEKL